MWCYLVVLMILTSTPSPEETIIKRDLPGIFPQVLALGHILFEYNLVLMAVVL